ncbi:MAG: hypothetical protein V1820_04035 [archaeon]
MTFQDLVLFAPSETLQRKVLLIGDRDGQIQKVSSEKRLAEEIIGVESADRMRLLKALATDSVDFILPNIEEAKIDRSLATLAKKEGCAVALSFSHIAKGDLKRTLARAARAVETLEYYNAPVLFATFAREPLFARDKRDLEGVLEILGSKRPEAWLSEAARIIERNLKRKGEIAPGVKLVE